MKERISLDTLARIYAENWRFLYDRMEKANISNLDELGDVAAEITADMYDKSNEWFNQEEEE